MWLLTWQYSRIVVRRWFVEKLAYLVLGTGAEDGGTMIAVEMFG